MDEEDLFFASLELDGESERREEIVHRGGIAKKKKEEPVLELSEIKKKFRMKTGAELLAQIQAREGAQLTLEDAVEVAKSQKPLDKSEKIPVKREKSTKVSQGKKKEEKVEKVREPFVLDFSEIDKLRKESDFVREALAVEEEGNSGVIQEIQEIQKNQDNLENQEGIENMEGFSLTVVEDEGGIFSEVEILSTNSAVIDVGGLSEELQEVWGNFSEFQKKAVCLIGNENFLELDEIVINQFLTVEILVDEVNQVALEYMGDILLEFLGDVPVFLEEYEELKSILL